MAPGEEDEEEFVEDVGVGDVEVVFEGGDVDVAVELGRGVLARLPVLCMESDRLW